MLSSLLAHADDDPQTAALAARGRRGVRLPVAAALPGLGAAGPRPDAPGDRRRRRRPRRARPRRGAEGLAGPTGRPLLPEPRRQLRVAPGPAAAPGRPAHRRARRPARMAERAPATRRRWSSSAPSRCRRRCPTRPMRPHGFVLRTGELIDLDETAMDLVAAGYERVDQVEDRGQFAIRGGLLDLFPATEDRAVRVDLFGDEIESLRWFSTFTQRSLDDADCVEVAPAAELALEHRELAEIAALEDASDRPDITELLPVENFHSFLELTSADAAGAHRRLRGRGAGAGRPLAGRHRRLPRRRRPPPLRRARRDHRPARPSASGSACRASTRTSRSPSARRPPTSPRAASRRPSPSWRSSPAPATARC